MGDTVLIGVAEVGRRTGVSRKALRHYEEIGLIEPVKRTEAGYRRYDEEALRRIELVNRAKLLGLSLTEAKTFLHVADGCCDLDHSEFATLVEKKLVETAARINDLASLRGTLESVLARLTANRGVHYCEESLCTCGPITIGRHAKSEGEPASSIKP